jgi:RHS repeat-associated protein
MYSQAGKLLYRETKDGGINYIFLGDKLIAKEGVMPISTNSRRHYKPFGDSIETPKDDVGYTGHKFDTDLGWSYMQQRYIDPVLGRFMSNDPVGFTGDITTFNRYSYVGNNPYKYTDPTGMARDGSSAAEIGSLLGSKHTKERNRLKLVDAKRRAGGGKQSVRKKLYPTRPRKTVKESTIAKATDSKGNVICAKCNNSTDKPTMQHDPALVDSHNSADYDTDQTTRNNIYNDTITEVNCESCQKSEGGATRATYREDKGPNFKPRPKPRRKR